VGVAGGQRDQRPAEVALRTQVTAFPTLTGATPRKLKFLDPISQITGGTAGAAGTSGVNASVAGAGHEVRGD
jgi:hypothetical protein